MSIEPLNTTPLVSFLQKVKSADASFQKEVRIPISEAKNLAFTIGIVMSRLEGELEKFVKENNSKDNEVITVTVDPGGDWR
jgi:hypothetical protein